MTRVQSEQEYRHLVGKRLRMQRHALDLSQDALVERTGLTRNVISALERGTQTVDAWRLTLLAEALSVPLEWLCNPEAGPVTVTSATTGQAGEWT